MKSTIVFLLLLIIVSLIAWLSYSAGYKTATEIRLDAQLSDIYNNASLKIKILSILSKGESERAVIALDAAVMSDLSSMRDYSGVRNELTFLNVIKSSLSEYGLQANTQKLDISDIDRLQSEYENINAYH